jgi:hypothetical protein
MFDLEESLRNWRENLRSAEAMQRSDVEELEHHVRDSIASLRSKGLSEQEAFAIATHRVGDSELIGLEFAKVNGRPIWTQRAFWMVAGILLFWVSQIVIATLSSMGEIAAALWSGNGIVMAVVPIGITVLSWAAMAIAVRKRFVNGSESAWRPLSATQLSVGIVTVTLIGTLMHGISNMALSYFATINEFGRATMIGSVAHSLLAILGPLILLAVLLALRQAAARSYPA